MATVRIGDRELEVKVATLGFLKRKLMPARKALTEGADDDYPDRIAALVLCYVEGNAGVDLDWLLDNLPADPSEIMRACIVASGQQVAKPGAASGEEARQ